ncbi:hypothetical protein PMIN06_010351 [Paraphaeosphaeria minitans]|uniref:MIP family channel protein (Aquaporin-1) n=1 Tax=Paraphaeosphaeria minitans TaxID=565426 RepID=A0A9P6G728_9PLEO|nr:MIP family channel protein (aquaporin-1) [Paraphaeosphaeria minitans]
MAQEQSSSLPQFYGQTMADGTMVESPKFPLGSQGSRDALLRLPIQPNVAHVTHQDQQLMSPISALPSSPNTMGMGPGPVDVGSRNRARPVGDSSRWMVPHVGDREREEEYYARGHRPGRGSISHRSAYVEDYSDDEDRPRAYRRPARKHARPPPARGGRYPVEQGGRGSMDRGQSSFEYGYESDTPTKPRIRAYYGFGSEGEDDGYRRPKAAYGDGGRRGPPRRPESTEEVMRLPWTMWMNSNAKNHFVAFVGEFVGTTMFLFFAFSGTQVANIHSAGSSNTTTGADTGFSPQVLQYISLVFGFSLMVNVWIFFRISGGLFNPAVTFAMLLTKAMSLVRFFLLLVAQLAGSIFSSFLVSVMFPTPLNVRTTLSADTSLVRGVFIEAVLTAELVFTIFMLAKEKHKATFIAPVGIGLALFVAELVGVYYTGGSLNPARSFGPCVVTGIFDREHWIYWVGPAAGAVLAVVFYNFIKMLEYEMANPDQDADDQDIKEKQTNDE